MTKKTERSKALVLIDGSNTYFAQKLSGIWLDWVKVKKYLESKFQVVEFRYYVGLRKDDRRMGKFISKLDKIYFKIISKPVKIISDQLGGRREKADFDVEITVDALLQRDVYDDLVVFSGDSDFLYLYKYLLKSGKKVVVYSTRKTIAWEIKTRIKYCLFEDVQSLTTRKEFDKL